MTASLYSISSMRTSRCPAVTFPKIIDTHDRCLSGHDAKITGVDRDSTLGIVRAFVFHSVKKRTNAEKQGQDHGAENEK